LLLLTLPSAQEHERAEVPRTGSNRDALEGNFKRTSTMSESTAKSSY